MKAGFLGALLAAGLMGACEAEEGKGEGTRAEQAIVAMFEAFNRRDLEAMAALYAPDARLESPGFEAPRTGRDGVRKTYTELFEELPDARDEVTSIVVEGDSAAVEFVATFSAGPEGALHALPIAVFIDFDENGLITRDRTYYDPNGARPAAQ